MSRTEPNPSVYVSCSASAKTRTVAAAVYELGMVFTLPGMVYSSDQQQGGQPRAAQLVPRAGAIV